MHHAMALEPQTSLWMHPATASKKDTVVQTYHATAMKPQAVVQMHPGSAPKPPTSFRTHYSTTMADMAMYHESCSAPSLNSLATAQTSGRTHSENDQASNRSVLEMCTVNSNKTFVPLSKLVQHKVGSAPSASSAAATHCPNLQLSQEFHDSLSAHLWMCLSSVESCLGPVKTGLCCVTFKP